MEPIILFIYLLLILLTVAVFIAFRQLCGEIKELEKEHESLKKSVLQSDTDLFQRWKQQQKDLGNLFGDFEQFKLVYGAALEYSREDFLVMQREETDRKAKETEKAKEAEKGSRVKAFTEKVLDALSKTLSDEKLTAEEASTRFEIELSFLVADYLEGSEVGIIMPDSAILQVSTWDLSTGETIDEHGRRVR